MFKAGNHTKVSENWNIEVKLSNWIHIINENKKHKHENHKATRRHKTSFVEGIKNKIKTPINGVIDVSTRGLKNFILLINYKKFWV